MLLHYFNIICIMLNVYVYFHCAFMCIVQHHIIVLCEYGAI